MIKCLSWIIQQWFIIKATEQLLHATFCLLVNCQEDNLRSSWKRSYFPLSAQTDVYILSIVLALSLTHSVGSEHLSPLHGASYIHVYVSAQSFAFIFMSHFRSNLWTTFSSFCIHRAKVKDEAMTENNNKNNVWLHLRDLGLWKRSSLLSSPSLIHQLW